MVKYAFQCKHADTSVVCINPIVFCILLYFLKTQFLFLIFYINDNFERGAVCISVYLKITQSSIFTLSERPLGKIITVLAEDIFVLQILFWISIVKEMTLFNL